MKAKAVNVQTHLREFLGTPIVEREGVAKLQLILCKTESGRLQSIVCWPGGCRYVYEALCRANKFRGLPPVKTFLPTQYETVPDLADANDPPRRWSRAQLEADRIYANSSMYSRGCNLVTFGPSRD